METAGSTANKSNTHYVTDEQVSVDHAEHHAGELRETQVCLDAAP